MKTNILYCQDNFELLTYLAKEHPESIDLIYIDPPFFSNRTYEIIWGNGAEQRAYEDRWRGGIRHYIGWLKKRLRLMHRVLAPTGSLFLHLDEEAVHYAKVELDDIFGRSRFQNEIIWFHQVLGAGEEKYAKHYPKAHETILYYSKSDSGYTFEPGSLIARVPFSKKTAIVEDAHGAYYTRRRMTRTATPEELARKASTVTRVDDPRRGRLASDVWDRYVGTDKKGNKIEYSMKSYQPPKDEKTKWKTQKPSFLLNRIISVHSKPGEIVADFFCGTGTTLWVAQMLGREWIGCDVSPTACREARKQLGRMANVTDVELVDYPISMDEILKLDGHEFQNLVVAKLDATPSSKKSGDMGIDGWTFMEQAPIQIKKHKRVGRPKVDEFATAVRRAGKTKGLFVAVGFTRGAYEETARQKLEEGLEIDLKTIEELGIVEA